LIPAALDNALTEINAGQVRARIVVEGANGPTSPKADEILRENGVLIVPDILANAGGVSVSYYEWVQNIQRFRWELDRVNAELEKTMRSAYLAVGAVAKERQVDLRTAAYILAIRRVAQATLSRRPMRQSIQI
jgi:glutamate dehydrogenase (NAD(P)+)